MRRKMGLKSLDEPVYEMLWYEFLRCLSPALFEKFNARQNLRKSTKKIKWTSFVGFELESNIDFTNRSGQVLCFGDRTPPPLQTILQYDAPAETAILGPWIGFAGNQGRN